MAMKLTTKGIKANDRSIEVEQLNLLHGRNGSGKSTVINALQFLALGYVPSLGKRPVDVAALMEGSEMEVELTLKDGRTMRRTLARTEKGYVQDAEVSWQKNAKPTESAKEILRQFGAEEIDVAEGLDVRQLLQATPNQRAARIEQLLESGKRPVKETVDAVARLTVMRLIPKLTEENMPALVSEAMPMVAERHRGFLYDNAPILSGKIRESGISGAMAWANEEKKRSSNGLQRSEAAAKAMSLRAVEVPEPSEKDIKDLEAKRDGLQQEYGAIASKSEDYERRASARKGIQDAIKGAEYSADRAAEALEEAESTGGDGVDELQKKSDEARKAIEALKAPAAPDFTPVRKIDKELEELHEKLDAITVPEIPDTNQVLYAAQKAQDDLQRAKSSPWAEVLAIAKELKDIKDQKTRAARLEKLARQGLGAGIDSLEQDLEQRKNELKEAVAAAEAARADRDAKVSEQQALEARAAQKAVDRDKLRTKLNGDHVKALAEFDAKKRQLVADRQAAERQIAVRTQAVDQARKEKEEAVRRLESLRDQLKGMGELPEAPADAGALLDMLEETKAELDKLIKARAIHGEIQNALKQIEEAQAERDVFGAIEWALQRQREVELNDAGGPLLSNMTTFLAAAGRKEKPFVKASGIGWTDADGREVQVQALSGGEWALYAAALASSVLLCRPAPIRVLLVEAGETDLGTLQQLMAGTAAIADGLTAAFILTPFPPMKAGKVWNVVNLASEPVAA